MRHIIYYHVQLWREEEKNFWTAFFIETLNFFAQYKDSHVLSRLLPWLETTHQYIVIEAKMGVEMLFNIEISTLSQVNVQI